jgi:protein-S-isoprenylcysteine O-methyltransferase Ste14
LLLFHAAGIALVSLGITRTFVFLGSRFPVDLRTLLGLGAVLLASALAMWALRVFASWRLLAHVDVGHALCLEGPYRFVRHPIYLALDLWALGSALTCPNALTIAGAVGVIIGSDLRSRVEERLLAEVFGDQYRSYAARVRRLLPGVY